MLARYLTDGSLDLDFGEDGIVFGGIVTETYYERKVSVALQPDGKIIATGGRTGLRRILPNGNVDEGFVAYLGFDSYAVALPTLVSIAVKSFD